MEITSTLSEECEYVVYIKCSPETVSEIRRNVSRLKTECSKWHAENGTEFDIKINSKIRLYQSMMSSDDLILNCENGFHLSMISACKEPDSCVHGICDANFKHVSAIYFWETLHVHKMS